MADQIQKQIEEVYRQWIEAITTARGDANKVLPLYAANAHLLATFSGELRCNTKDQLRSYFEMFTGLENLVAETPNMHIRVLDDSLAIATGFYTFTHTKDGQRVRVPARFSFVYSKIDDNWLIINHHSSLVPSV